MRALSVAALWAQATRRSLRPARSAPSATRKFAGGVEVLQNDDKACSLLEADPDDRRQRRGSRHLDFDPGIGRLIRRD